jgi:hypothetical protein
VKNKFQYRNLYVSTVSVPLWGQLVIALVCGLLDYFSSILFAPHIPLYLDMTFTLFASYFGWIAGLGAAVVHHICSITAPDGLVSFPFIICSFTGAAIICLFLRKNKKIGALDLILIALVMSFIIAIEGGIIYTVLFVKYDYIEHMVTKYFTLSLVFQHIPIVISAILSRIPTNLADKSIAVILSWLMALGFQKATARHVH